MYERELHVAMQAALLAGRYLLEEYERFEVIPDAPADITTDADRRSQEIILGAIRAAFPADALCAEEATATPSGTNGNGANGNGALGGTTFGPAKIFTT